MRYRTGEYSLAPITSIDQETQFEKTSAIRKISVGSRIIRTVTDHQQQHLNLMKNRSVSQIQPPPVMFYNKMQYDVQHPSWTCAGTIADFLVAGLTDLDKPVMSPQMATSWGYFNIDEEIWDVCT